MSPTHTILTEAIAAGRSADCPSCATVTCPSHAATAVLNASPRVVSRIMSQSTFFHQQPVRIMISLYGPGTGRPFLIVAQEEELDLWRIVDDGRVYNRETGAFDTADTYVDADQRSPYLYELTDAQQEAAGILVSREAAAALAGDSSTSPDQV